MADISLAELGDELTSQGKLGEAVRCYRAALQLNPDDAAVLANLGRALQRQMNLVEAEACYRRAIQMQPQHPWFHTYLSTLLLAKGAFREGWREFEWMWRIKEVAAAFPAPDKPLWDGSLLAGRTCLVDAPFGFGDTLQWSRYASYVADGGGGVIVRCAPELARLFRTLPRIDQVLADDEPLPAFDVYALLMRLPCLLGSAEPPADVPYLRPNEADAGRWAAALPPRAGLRVGLVWSADPNGPGPERSLPLAALRPLADVAGVTLFGLQKGAPAEQLHALPSDMPVTGLGDHLNDFADTAALLTQLDLLITVDTAAAHLAGAMGRPLWILLPYLPDARWLLNREDSPWYPSARLFRQPQPGAWSPVIERVASELAKLAQR
jgi:hypothetical protein